MLYSCPSLTLSVCFSTFPRLVLPSFSKSFCFTLSVFNEWYSFYLGICSTFWQNILFPVVHFKIILVRHLMCHTYKLILSSLIPVISIDSFLSQSMCFNKNNPSSPHLLQPPMMTSDIQLSWSLQLQSPFSRPLCFPRSPRGEHQGLRGGSDSVAPRVTGTA